MAGIIGEEDIQKVREASDIVSIVGERAPLRQRGRDFWCCCPFHDEKTPSMKVDPTLQLWHCFGCGEGGDVFGFVMKADDLTFPEAVRKLAERAHIEIESVRRSGGVSSSHKARLKDVCKATADFYHTQLMRSPAPDAAAARAYLAGRGMGGEVPRRWNLGFAPGKGALVRHLGNLGFKPKEMLDANVAVERSGKLRDRFYNRVMFPIRDVQGEAIAFGGRVVGTGEPKYLNSQETPLFHKSQVLFGLDRAKAAMASTGVAVVVEGYTDVIALSEAGMKNVVATLGTALTRQHIRLLSRHAQRRIVYLFDGDEAGQRAADRALGFIDDSMTPEAGRSQIELAAVTLPDNLDPAEFVAAHGADALRKLVDGAQPLLKYGIERRLAAHDLSRAEGRAAALADALSVLAPIKDSLLAKDYAVQIAGRTRAREQDALDALARLVPPRRPREDAVSEGGGARAGAASGMAGTSGAASGAASGASGIPGAAGGRGVQDALAATGAQGVFGGSDARGAAPGGVRDVGGQALAAPEANRRRLEREFLGLLARNPSLAVAHIDALAQTQWHDEACSRTAQEMLAVLADDAAPSSAQLVAKVAQAFPPAAGMLTAGGASEGSDPADAAAFLAEELGIGDAEEAVAALRAQMSDPASLSPEDYEVLFESVVAMQKDISRRRLAHRPLAVSE